jgi:hypothetical protein
MALIFFRTKKKPDRRTDLAFLNCNSFASYFIKVIFLLNEMKF